jgi:hypothetical protein
LASDSKICLLILWNVDLLVGNHFGLRCHWATVPFEPLLWYSADCKDRRSQIRGTCNGDLSRYYTPQQDQTRGSGVTCCMRNSRVFWVLGADKEVDGVNFVPVPDRNF